MLVYFRIRNFKSVVDTTIDMRYGEGKAPNGYRNMKTIPFISRDVSGLPPVRLSPVMAIYGQNAGGKTTIVEAFQVLRFFLYDGQLKYYPNKLHPELRKTTFEIACIHDQELFTYYLTYNQSGILSELLRTQTQTLFSIDHESGIYDFKRIGTENYPEKRLYDILLTECSKNKSVQFCTFLGKIAKNYPGLNAGVSDAYTQLVYCISSPLNNAFHPRFAIQYLAEEKERHSDEKAFQEIVEYLKYLDIDISKMEIQWEEEPLEIEPDYEQSDDEVNDTPYWSRDEFRIKSYHKDTKGELVALDFKEESRGTQVLFGLLGVILRKLHTGGTLIIDEMDRSLHPLLLIALISFFSSKEYNINGAQLILTAHNTELLESGNLRTSQVAIVSKTKQGGTVARRLCDFEGVRNVKNFRKAYLEGSFSGIPFPMI